MTDTKTKKQAKRLRLFRKIHRLTGACLFIFFFIVSISGLMLGWKKHSGGLILPKSQKGVSTKPADWKTLDELHERATKVFRSQNSDEMSAELERIDVRPDKGMVKFVFAEDYQELQLDLTTGEVLQIGTRRHDFIENIHDGSVLDYIFGVEGGYLKLLYSTIMGVALFTFTVTGFWLWFGPKRLRRHREAEQSAS